MAAEDDGSDWALPSPKALPAQEALVQLKRRLREGGDGLAERHASFELRGMPVLRWSTGADGVLRVELAKRPAQRPEWQAFAVGDAAALRKLTEEIARRRRGWQDDDA